MIEIKIVFILFIVSIPAVTAANSANQICNASRTKFAKKAMDATVSIDNPLIYQFNSTPDPWDIVKIEFEVLEMKEKNKLKDTDYAAYFPISVTLHAKGAVSAFTVPFGPDQSFSRKATWLCPRADEARKFTMPEKKDRKGKKSRPSKDEITKLMANVPDSDDDNQVAAIATISTESRKPIKVKTSVVTMSLANFIIKVDSEQQYNASAKASEPYVHFVQIPDNVGAVRVHASSKDNLCGVLAIQSITTCPFVSLDDIERAYRRLTFTSQGTVVVGRSEMESFYVVTFPYPNDGECGGLEDVLDTRLNQKKSIFLQVSSVSSFSEYAVPILVTLAFYSVFFLAIAPIKILKALTTSPTEKRQEISIRADEDASASRPESPRPTSVVHGEPQTGHLLSISSPGGSVVNEEVAGPSNVNLAPTPEKPEVLVNVPLGSVDATPIDSAKLMMPDNPAQSAPSDVSCVLARMHESSAANLGLDMPTNTYAWIHAVLCGFLLLVVLQQTTWIHPIVAQGGNLDLCYYNGQCGAPLGSIASFNHTVSNIGYVALGILALLILKRRYKKFEEELRQKGSGYVHTFGLPVHYGMMTALGIGMIAQGILSAVYHQCPNSSSIQFESINVYLTALLALLKLYGARHEPTQPHVAYGVALAFWTLATVSSVANYSAFWWLSFVVIEMILMPLLSLQIYYHGHVAYSMASAKSALNSVRHVLWANIKEKNWKPLFGHRLTALAIFNIVNMIMSVVVALKTTMTISEYILAGMIVNLIFYFAYYLGNKISANECIQKVTWFYLVAAAAFWIAALTHFFAATMDWKVTPAQSRAMNQECSLFGFYDSHDLWHLLSSVAIFFSFMSLLTLDDELKTTRRRDISVF